MDEIAILTTLMLYVPVGLLTCFQVAEAGRRATWRSASRPSSPPPETSVTNGNARREAWVHTARSCASLSSL